MTDRYTSLRNVLDAAFAQAATGKGAERHANGEDWTKQPIFTIARQVGDGFNAGQVIKKVQEAQQMAARGEFQRAQHEVLGAIVYAASLHVLWDRPAQSFGRALRPAPPEGKVSNYAGEAWTLDQRKKRANVAPPVSPAPSTRAAQGDERRYFLLHDWSGGECPVPPETHVVVQLRYKDELSALCEAGSLVWQHYDNGSDIIRYGVVKEAPSVEEINELWQRIGRVLRPVPPTGKVPNCKCVQRPESVRFAPPVPPAPSTPCAPPWDKPNHPWPIDPPLTRWQGGDIPVKLGDLVKLWLRRGEVIVTRASSVSWKHSGRPDDILAFELVDAA